MYETIFSPVNYGGLELKNRIIFAPTTFGLSDEEYFAKIRAIAAGGCAMIIVGDVPVGKSRLKSLCLTKRALPGTRAWRRSSIAAAASSAPSCTSQTPTWQPCSNMCRAF